MLDFLVKVNWFVWFKVEGESLLVVVWCKLRWYLEFLDMYFYFVEGFCEILRKG